MNSAINATAQNELVGTTSILPMWNSRVYTIYYEGSGYRFESDRVLSDDDLREILERTKEQLGWKLLSKINKERWLKIEEENARELMLVVWLGQNIVEGGLTIEAFLSAWRSGLTNDANTIVPFMQMWRQEMAKNAPLNL